MIKKYKFQLSILIFFDIFLSFGILLEGKLPSIFLHAIYFTLYGIIIKEFLVPKRLSVNNFYLYFGLLASQAILPFYFSLLNLSVLTLYMLPLFLLLRFLHRESIRLKDVYQNKVALIFFIIGLFEFIQFFRHFSSQFRTTILMDSFSYFSVWLLVVSFSKMKIDLNKLNLLLKFIISPLVITVVLSIISSGISITSFFSPLFRLGDYNNEGSNSFAFLMLVGVLLTLQIIKNKGSALFFFLFLFFILSLYLTKTLGVLIPTILLLPIFFLRKKLSFALIPILLILTIVYVDMTNIMSFREGGDNNLFVRTRIWDISIDLIAKNPVFGVSRDYFDANIIHTFFEKKNMTLGLTTHNFILKIFIFNGILIGFLFLIAIILIIIRNIRFINDSSKKSIALLIIISTISHMSMDAWYFIYFALIAFTFADFNLKSSSGDHQVSLLKGN